LLKWAETVYQVVEPSALPQPASKYKVVWAFLLSTISLSLLAFFAPLGSAALLILDSSGGFASAPQASINKIQAILNRKTGLHLLKQTLILSPPQSVSWPNFQTQAGLLHLL
jgi:hypothetical protein